MKEKKKISITIFGLIKGINGNKVKNRLKQLFSRRI